MDATVASFAHIGKGKRGRSFFGAHFWDAPGVPKTGLSAAIFFADVAAKKDFRCNPLRGPGAFRASRNLFFIVRPCRRMEPAFFQTPLAIV
jgi:hypothetical protein